MARVIKYGDTTGIESDFKQAPVGLYYAKVESIEQKTSKNDEEMVEVKFTVTKDANGKKLKEKYAPIWYYAPLDTESSWARRLKELVAAFALKLKGGNLGVIEGKEAMIRLREGTDQDGDYRPNIGKVLNPTKTKADVDEEEEEESEDGQLDGMSRAELKKLIKDEGLEITVKRSMSDDDLREAIQEVWEPEEADEESEEEEEEEEEEVEDNYDDMSLKELKEELENRELDTKGRKPVLIARLRTDDQEEPV